MTSSSMPPAIESEVGRIRELSKNQRFSEALVAAEALAIAAPDNRHVTYLVAANQRCLNRIQDAVATLTRLEEQHPRFSLLYQERGQCYLTLRDVPRAIEAFQRAVSLNPALPTSWSLLERLYRMTGDRRSASVAADHLSTLKLLPPEIVRAGSLLSDGELSVAESILRAFLLNAPQHAEAFRLLARIERERNALDDAESLLETSLKLDPSHRSARVDLARTLLDRQKYPQALEAIDRLLTLDPCNEEFLSLYAAACVGLGRHERAIEVYRQLIARSPGVAELHVALGHSLKAVGHGKEAVGAYKTGAAIRPGLGDVYWSLANLKTFRFSLDEIARMRAEEAAPNAHPVDRCHLCFALGRAYEDLNAYAESWAFYERGNRLKRAETQYQAEVTERHMQEQIEVCTRELFAAHAGAGSPALDPILIVGLPRSGSTLVEQILASHSQVEGTQELFDIQRIALEMRGRHRSELDESRYPRVLRHLSPEDFKRFGERYISDTRSYRGSQPFFVDKMPNNFRHIGLIHLMLPNARIIDVRREPMACCFSNLKQLFASGQEFTYGIEDVSRYYRAYLNLMRHWDAVLPGRVLRVCYEDVVEDLEANVKRILAFCGVAFEPACVEFYKTERSVHTASSEQVRQPIFRHGLVQWRNYGPWLGPLEKSLGDALIRYRE